MARSTRRMARNVHGLPFGDFLRDRPCCICLRQPAEPSHLFKYFALISYAGIGQKGSDYLAIPMCRYCHVDFHVGKSRQSREELITLIVLNLVSYLLSLRREHPCLFAASSEKVDLYADLRPETAATGDQPDVDTGKSHGAPE